MERGAILKYVADPLHVPSRRVIEELQSLITNSVHTALSDIQPSVIVIVGFKIGQRQPDFDYSYIWYGVAALIVG